LRTGCARGFGQVMAMMSDVMTDVDVRRATPADLGACAAIVNADIDQRDFMPRTQSAAAISAMFVPSLLEDRVMLVAERAGRVVGYLSSMRAGDVRGFYVLAQAQGAGVGQALMDRAKAEFPDGLRLTVYVSDQRARAFYERQGFGETGGVSIDEEGMPIMHLSWLPK
jgi:putative acetyltransferase